MKKQYLPLVLFMTLIVAGLFACKKSSNNPTPSTPSTTGQQFACKIDGKQYTNNNGRYYAFAVGTGYQIVGDSPTYTIEISVPSTNTGKVTLGDQSTVNKYATVFFNAGSKHYISTEGEVNITKSDGSKMSGTFNYKAKDAGGNVVVVTDGEFNDIPKK